MPKKIVVTREESLRIRDRYEQLVPLLELEKEFGYSRPFLAEVIRKAGGSIRNRGRVRASKKVAPVFLNKLSHLSEDILREPLNKDVTELLIDYVLRLNDGRTFCKIDRRYGYGDALSQFRKDHLEPSYYMMGKLWRAVYRTSSYKNVNLALYGVSEDDVVFFLNHMSDKSKDKIVEWTRSRKYIFLPNEQNVHNVVSECEKAIKAIVNSKLRFISKYDPCYEKEDLESYLRGVAYKVAIKYDWEMVNGEFAFEKCLNYTKRSLWNASFLLIKQNTSEDYSRLAKVDTDRRLYQVTTVSLDSAKEDSSSVHNRICDTETEDVELENLVQDLSFRFPGAKEYLNLDMENNPEFLEYIMKHTGMDEHTLYTTDFERWRILAMDFSGISNEDRKVMQEYVSQTLSVPSSVGGYSSNV